MLLPLLLACLPPEGHLDTAWSMPYEASFHGFSWVIDGQLAGMPQPTQAELSWAAEEGMTVLISLTEGGTDPAMAAEVGVEVIHIPVEDMTAPTLHQLHRFVTTAGSRMSAGEPVGVHCYAGMGRTGTFLAAWFVWAGMGPAEAIDHVRTLRPGSIETDEQELVIFRFAEAAAADTF